MTRLIVFTDLHILADPRARIIGLDPAERLLNGVRHVNRHHRGAARVIFTGDLAHHGEPAAYARLKSILDELEVPFSLLIGNHDSREAFVEAFPDAPRDEHGFVQQVLDLPEGRLVMLDTLKAPPYVFPESYAGWLCERRLEWLDRQLAGANGGPAYVFMHHPPHATGFPGMDSIGLANGDDFYALLARRGNVRHVFAGHVHRTISGTHRGVPFSVFKSPAHQQPMSFDSDDHSLSVDEPGAYGIVFLHEHGVLVHSEDYEISTLEAGSSHAAPGHG